MQYVPFGKTGLNVSRLGFGMMRLPTIDKADGSQKIDRDLAIKMVRRAIDAGVNYVDTAYGYHGGESEIVTGLALQDGYREKTLLATKLPQWLVREKDDMDRLLDEQLQKLDVDHIDFYLLHALNGSAFDRLKTLDYAAFLDRAKRDGRIRYAAFSFHDDKDAFKRILDDYGWDMAQIQFNYLDEKNQATLDGLLYAGEKGIPVVVMEPLRGGALANPPPDVRQLIKNQERGWSPVAWAFRYAGNFPEVALILSGMSDMTQVEDNLRIFEDIKPHSLTPKDEAFIRTLRGHYESRIKVSCTGCNYCQPCPQGVLIPRIFEIYNEAYQLNQPDKLNANYKEFIEKHADASLCAACGECEAACPQSLPIIELLKEIDAKARGKV
jgi:predicted aldo/keto reductase-like oxidoreductase